MNITRDNSSERAGATLLDVAEALGREADPHAGLRTAARLLADGSGAAYCRILSVNGESGAVWAHVTRDGAHPSEDGVEVDVASDPLFSRVWSSETALFTHGPPVRAALPLSCNQTLVGIVELGEPAYEQDGAEGDGFRELPLDDRERMVLLLAADALARHAMSRLIERRDSERLLATASPGEVDLSGDLRRRLTLDAEGLMVASGYSVCDVYAIEGDRLRSVLSVEGEDHRNLVYEGSAFALDDYPASRRALESGDVVWVPDTGGDLLSEGERKALAWWGYRSWLAVPLRLGDRAVGLAELSDSQVREHAPDESDLRDIAVDMGRDLQGMLLLSSIDVRQRLANALVEIAAEVSSDLDAAELARILAHRVQGALGVADCDVWRLDGGVLRCVASWDDSGLDRSAEEVVMEAHLFSTSSMAMSERRPVMVEDCLAHDMSGLERRVYTTYGFRSSLTVPLLVADRVVGVVDIYDRRPRDYTDVMPFVVSACRLVAAALESAWLTERLNNANADLHALVEAGSRVASSLDFDGVMRAIAKCMCQVAHVPTADIYTVEDGVAVAQCSVSNGLVTADFQGQRFPLDDFYFLERGRPEMEIVRIADVRNDPRVSPCEREEWLRFGAISGVLLPLVARGCLVGQALLLDRVPRTFDELDAPVALGQIAAQAIANARQYRDLSASAQRLALVNQVGVDLTSSLDVERVLTSAATKLCEVIDVPRCDIFLREDQATVRCVASSTNGARDEGWLDRRFPIAEWYVTQAVMESGDTVAIEAVDDPRLSDAERRDMERWGERSGLFVPLRVGDRTIGDAELFETRRQRGFSADERAAVEAVCRVASLAIENARLFEKTKSLHLDNLRGLTSALTAKDYYTLGHAGRVSAYMVLLGEELGWDKGLLERMEEAAYLHDIGKISISDRILLKRGPLNDEEWEQIRQHPTVGADILRPLFAPELVAAVRHHHERWDGDGYPDGLSGESIPELARALSVVDAYDAMSHTHPYHESRIYPECVEELAICAGGQFDAKMTEAFQRVLDRLERSRLRAERVARMAAERLDVDGLAALRTPADEALPEYAGAASVLRAARDSDEVIRYVQVVEQRGKNYAIVAEAEESGDWHSPIGEEVFPHEGLRLCFAGEPQDIVMVAANQWGVWVTGVAPVTGHDGEVAYAVMADIPVEHVRLGGVRSDAAQPLAALLHAAAVRLTKAEIDAVTDGLTGLYNHRHLQDRLTEEAERAARCEDRLAVLFCDLDDFKKFNDTYGHRMGDGVLEGTARAIESSVRRGDVVARYGGEEFVVLIAGADERTAIAAAERIRAAVAGLSFTPDGAAVTLSVGIALCPEHGRTREELLAAADAAMYTAKTAGRDRITVYNRESGGAADRAACTAPEAVTAKAPSTNAGGDRRLGSIERRAADRRARERRASQIDRRSPEGDRRRGLQAEPPVKEGDGAPPG